MKIFKLVEEKSLSMGAACDQLLEASSAMVDVTTTSVWNTQRQMVKLHINITNNDK